MPQRNLHVNCHVNGATSQSGVSSLWVSGCKIKIKNESERASESTWLQLAICQRKW